MEKEKTVRLIYPQWQGASVVDLLPELKYPEYYGRRSGRQQRCNPGMAEILRSIESRYSF